MNSEYALDSCKNILTTYLPSMILTIESESSATYSAPTPTQFIFGPRDVSNLTIFPSVLVVAKNSISKNDQYQWQERTMRIEIICWIVEVDMEKLHRFVLRYADAVIRCLREERYWATNLYFNVSNEATYTDIYQTTIGVAQGCLITCDVEYLIS